MQKRQAQPIEIPYGAEWLKRDADTISNGVFDEKYMERLKNGTEHYFERHAGVSITDMLERVVTENKFYRKNSASSFVDEEKTQECLENAILDNADLIAAWLGKEDSSNTLVCYTERSDTPIGEGVMCEQNSLFHYKSYAGKLVLGKDFHNPYNPANFRIKSIYPSGDQEDIELTNRDISKDLYQTKTYQHCDETIRIKLDDFINNGIEFVSSYSNGWDSIYAQDTETSQQKVPFSDEELSNFVNDTIGQIHTEHIANIDVQSNDEYEIEL